MRPSSHSKKYIITHTEGIKKSDSLKKGSLTKVPLHTRFKDQVEYEPNRISEVETASIKLKYDRAMQMAREGENSQKESALNTLHNICIEIR